MIITKKVLNKKFIDLINEDLDKYNYLSSLWIFPGESPTLYKKIKDYLSKNEYFKKIIAHGDNYIVLRLVNQNEKKRALEAHFDNYNNTYYVPLKLPKQKSRDTYIDNSGSLYFWENARSMPKSILTHIATKLLFQNKFTAFILNRYLRKRFKKAKVSVGDVLFFNGFTTLHFNSSVNSEHRALVIHNSMPFEKHFVENWIDRYSRYRVRK